MNFLLRVLASEQRQDPFKTWQYDSIKQTKDYLRFSFKHFKREEDLEKILYSISRVTLIRIEHAFYLGLQGEITEKIQGHLTDFSPQSMDNFEKLIEFLKALYGISEDNKNPLDYILRELIKNALEGSLKFFDPHFELRNSDHSTNEEYHLRLATSLRQLESKHPNVMKFYINLMPRFNAQKQKTPHITFFIISPPMSKQNHEKLNEKIQKYYEYKNAGKTFNEYIRDEYFDKVEANDGHGLGTLTLLNVVDSYWNGRARIEFNIDDTKTQISLSIEKG
jgi:coenzyme F420-reducing hydrogenase alpha subunit